jgi:hypothetical protein
MFQDHSGSGFEINNGLVHIWDNVGDGSKWNWTSFFQGKSISNEQGWFDSLEIILNFLIK